MAVWSEEMRAPMRRLRLGGKIVLGSGREIALDGEMISALTIEEGTSGMVEAGCVLSAECTLDLSNEGGQWDAGGEYLGQGELVGATLAPELGVVSEDGVLWQALGVFQVESANRIEEEARLRLRAKDSIAFELANGFEDGINYPCTLQALWEHAVGQTGYLWSGNVPNGKAMIDVLPDWNGASLRTALGYIAAAAGCFVCVDRSGNLELCPLWSGRESVFEIDRENCLKMENGCARYGPVDALKLKCAGADETSIYTTAAGTTLFAVSVSENPLFQADAMHVDALAQGLLQEMAGLKGEALNFEWRGDPTVRIGERVKIYDRSGCEHEGILTRQTLRISSGFSTSSVCEIPQDNNSGVRRAITPEGGLNSAALVGAVNGSLLSVGSVTTNKLAAGSITAEKLAAGAVDAGALSAVTAKIGKLTAADINTDSLAAAMAAFTVVTAGTAKFDKATVTHLVAEALNLNFGTAGTVFIQNLAVQYAQMVGAAIGNLCIKASDGNYYQIDVNRNGSVTATKTTLSEGEIAVGQTSGGRVILETNITAANLSTGNLLATYALVNRIDAARIDVDELFAREAFIDMLRTSKIMGGQSLEIVVRNSESSSKNFYQEKAPTSADYVRPGDTWTIPSTGEVWQAKDMEYVGLKFYIDDDLNLCYALDVSDGSITLEVREDGCLYAEGICLSVLEDGTMGTPYIWARVQDSELKGLANSAQNSANAAQSSANAAQSTANSAQTAANSAQNSANAAQSSANAAQSTANSAQTAASNAQSAADAAQSSADAAQSTADEAQATADSAVNGASEAMNKANAALSQADFERVVRIDTEGLHVGDNKTDVEVLIDSASMNVVIEGTKVSTYSDKFIRLDNMQVRKVRGGLAISVYKGSV